MRAARLTIMALLGLVLLSNPSMAHSHFGFGFGSGYYGDSYYGGNYGRGYYGGNYPYGGFYGPYGAPVYGAPVYNRTMVVPQGGIPVIPRAYGYIDDGEYRNYRDTSGAYIGRIALDSIPPGRW